MEERAATRGPCWFVGPMYAKGVEQSARFVQEGVWQYLYEEKYHEKYREAILSIRAGDRIALKIPGVRKQGLPFDNRGKDVAFMTIPAIGTVTENLGDGRNLKVAWQTLNPPREWYFHTHLRTVWRVMPSSWHAQNLIAFAFEGKAQDMDRFRNAPYWRDRFGDKEARFQWTRFYETFADKLLEFRNRRDELLDGIRAVAESNPDLPTSALTDHLPDGAIVPLADICPFTVMGLFNRRIKTEHRQTIAGELGAFLGVEEAIPEGFEGIPVLNNLKSWFFAVADSRKPDDIDILWEIFAQGLALAGTENESVRQSFVEAYDRALAVKGVKWNLGIGLYWIRPWTFPPLDGKTRAYIENKLHIPIGTHGPGKISSGSDYLKLLGDLNTRFEEENYPVHSPPELSLSAWLSKEEPAADPDGEESSPPDIPAEPVLPYYTVEDIMAEGCFLDQESLLDMLDRLRNKKNLILQGPPGTGKTWLAKRLAFALMEHRDESRLLAVQFHPNLSYEDFIRGWRPSGEGKLTLADGPFMEMVTAAAQDPQQVYVVVIEEINRGNPAQIFGEMLTLLEADKRTPDEALALSAKRTPDERVFIPDNLHLIGTMNIADRSLALVDLALRRRFAFVELEPVFGTPWRSWVAKTNGIDEAVLAIIEERLTDLNQSIAEDAGLGPQFRIGHSYVTPPAGGKIEDGWDWFRRIVETEIGPLLDEYWYDAPEKARDAKKRLLKEWSC